VHGHGHPCPSLPHSFATLQLQALMAMQMDAGFKKEQIGTLFCLVGAMKGGFGGWVVPQGRPPQKVRVRVRVTQLYPPAKAVEL
jgi:hypothetical protein